MNATIYMATYDTSLFLLPGVEYLFAKYWPQAWVKVLGYAEPAKPLERFEFVSMAPAQEGIERWGSDLASVIEKDADEFVAFMLDDFLVRRRVDLAEVAWAEDAARDFDRFELSDSPANSGRALPGQHARTRRPILRPTIYKSTCQLSIWRKRKLLECLRAATSPWHFETKVWHDVRVEAAASAGAVVDYIQSGVLSRRWAGRIKLSGLDPDDQQEFVKNGWHGGLEVI